MYRNTRNCNCGCNYKYDEYDDNYMEQTCADIFNSYNNTDMCSCGFDEDNTFPSNYMYAQSYVPWQTMKKTFTPCVGLKMGTIFPELVSPYMPGQSQMQIEYLKGANKIGEGCNR